MLEPDFEGDQDLTALPKARVLRRADVPALPGRIAIVRIGHVTVVLVETRSALPDVAGLRDLGIDPDAFHVIAVKTGFIPDAYLEDGRQPWLALTSGVTDHRSVQPIMAAPDDPIPHTTVIRRR